MNLELAQARMEDSPALWCGLVNQSPDAAAKISSKSSPAELELFNKVVSDMTFSLLYLFSEILSESVDSISTCRDDLDITYT